MLLVYMIIIDNSLVPLSITKLSLSLSLSLLSLPLLFHFQIFREHTIAPQQPIERLHGCCFTAHEQYKNLVQVFAS